METSEVTRYRNYSGPCRGCGATEMVKCSSDCTYLDDWEDFYMGPTSTQRVKARDARIDEVGYIRGVYLRNS